MSTGSAERKKKRMDHDVVDALLERGRELVRLKSILSTLSWDQETMMPPRGGPFRAQQRSTLAAICHQRLTDPELGRILEDLSSRDLDPWIGASVRELTRDHRRAVLVPESLVRELSETCSLAYESWVTARKESDFASFSPWLERILRLKREEARCLEGPGSLYERLLDDFEPGMTTGELDRLFSHVGPRLTSLLHRIQSSPHQPDPGILRGDFPIDRQESFGREVLAAMGFEWDAGRLDRSPHPFCSGLTPLDVRITTRYLPTDFSSSFFAMVHEGGHALYEQGLEPERYGLPACDAVSMGIHESQSRLWENQIARGGSFWEHWLPVLQRTFPGQLDRVPLEQFLHAVNRVRASLIRVESDEVSYGLHVILRYELEKRMIDGSLEVSDLEEAWNAGMRDSLGVVPRDSAEGVLQDVHWSQGAIGYFPTYLLGNLYSAQIYGAAQRSMPDLEENIREGRLKPLREWLRETIHRHGRTLTAGRLIADVSGEALKADYFLAYLEEKFKELYRLN